MPAFYGLNLVCADIDATAAFYRLLGVETPEVWRTATGAHHVGEMIVARDADIDIDLDSTTLAEFYNAGYRDAPTPGGTVMGFRVDSRDEVDTRP